MSNTEIKSFEDSNSLPSHRMNPWFSMWFRPRATIENLIDTAREFDGWIFALILAGIGQKLGDAWLDSAAETSSVVKILVISSIGGVIGAIFSLVVFGFLVLKIGQFLGGTASRDNVMVALGWSGVPFALSLLVWVPMLLLDGERMFSDVTELEVPALAVLVTYVSIGLFVLVISLWSAILFVISLSQVQKYSKWKSLVTSLLAGVIASIPYILFLLAFR